MKLRTEVNIVATTAQRIKVEHQVFSIGSCFASEMSQRLSDGQLRTLHNPFGTIFNPYSIHQAMQRITANHHYTASDLIFENGRYLSLDHHTSFDHQDETLVLENINQNIQSAHHFLKEAQWIIITYGTSFIYEYLPTRQPVANCHKIPQQRFSKRLLSDAEIQNAMAETIACIQNIAPEDVQILFSISPVRHTKEGMIENQWSKAKLINQLHQVIAELPHAHYLPIYEIMVDDLRDYRFYKADMIHPTPQAVDYIFEQFMAAYAAPETRDFIKENFKILNGLQHRPLLQDEAYTRFLDQLKQKMAQQQAKVSFPIFKEERK